MKIALISEFFYPDSKGGVEKRYHEIAENLSSQGNEVHWFASTNSDHYIKLSKSTVYYHRIMHWRSPYTKTGRRSILQALNFSFHVMLCIRSLNKQNYDLVDCSVYPFMHCFFVRFLLRKNTPLIITWYEFWGDYWFEYLGILGFGGRFIERMAVALSRNVIAVSSKTYKGLCHISGVPLNIALIPNGIDLRKIDSIGESAEKSDVIYVGRLKAHKNVSILIRAIGFVRELHPNVKVFIVGSGPEMSNLRSLTKTLGLEENVRYFGAIESESEIYSLLKSSKIFVHPSTKEGGGSLTLLEANACGKPIVAVKSDLGIDEDLIEEGKNGYWVEALEPRLFADRIVHLLDNRVLLDEICGNSRRFVFRYSWDNICSQYIEYYGNLGRCHNG